MILHKCCHAKKFASVAITKLPQSCKHVYCALCRYHKNRELLLQTHCRITVPEHTLQDVKSCIIFEHLHPPEKHPAKLNIRICLLDVSTMRGRQKFPSDALLSPESKELKQRLCTT